MKFHYAKPLGMDLPFPSTTFNPSQLLEHIAASVLSPFTIGRSITHTHLMGSASRAIAANDDARWDTEFVDARQLDKSSTEDIAKHFRELIAPAEFGRLVIFWEQDTQFDLDELADSIVRINQTAPDIADCLVELRLSDAFRLLHNFPTSTNTMGKMKCELDHCYSGVLAVVLLWRLRKFAEQCATQIHRPMGWNALDNLDKKRSGSTLTVGTL